MLRTSLLLGGLAVALCGCGHDYYPPPPRTPPVPAPDISRVTPPPPPIEAIRPKV